jgi:NodT family efflux transporter outer membrane factor (OMF) lipoprotein
VIAPGLPSELLSRRPDLRKAEWELAAAMADVGVAKADLYPKFDLTLGLGLQSQNTSSFATGSSRYWSIVPGLSLPIFNRGQVKAAVAQKQAVYTEKLAAFRASYHTALEDVENTLSSYYSEQGRRQNLEESLRHNQEALNLAQERYRRGLTSFLDVLAAQTSLLTTQSSLTQSHARLLTDLVSLYKALGGGWNALPVTPASS